MDCKVVILDELLLPLQIHRHRGSEQFERNIGVGKSCILMHFIERQFRMDCDATIGVEFGSKTIKLQSKVLKLQIWDTAGQQAYKSITRSYYRGTIGAILVYDVTSRKSFDNIARWLQQTRNFATTEKICILMVGNKIDLGSNRQVSLQEGQVFAKMNDLMFLECSARSGYNVDQIFESLSRAVLDKVGRGEIDTSDESGGVKIGEHQPLNTQTKGRNCC